MQNKAYNRTLFVAALSVYLGLLIVGAPPQVFGQQQIVKKSSPNRVQENKSGNENQVDEIDCRNFTVAEVVRLFAEQSEKLTTIVPTTFSQKEVYRNGQIAELKILVEEGEKFILTFFRNRATCQGNQKLSYGTLDDIPTSSIFNFRLNQDEIVFDVISSFANAESAKKFAQLSEYLFVAVTSKKKSELSQTTATEKAEIFVLENTKVRHENNQVFIVTRLPRAGLEVLLKADEKAN
jgi:hypothetical protein